MLMGQDLETLRILLSRFLSLVLDIFTLQHVRTAALSPVRF